MGGWNQVIRCWTPPWWPRSREQAAVDDGFPERRELWRMCGYLAVIAVAGHEPYSRAYVTRLADAVRSYR